MFRRKVSLDRAGFTTRQRATAIVLLGTRSGCQREPLKGLVSVTCGALSGSPAPAAHVSHCLEVGAIEIGGRYAVRGATRAQSFNDRGAGP